MRSFKLLEIHFFRRTGMALPMPRSVVELLSGSAGLLQLEWIMVTICYGNNSVVLRDDLWKSLSAFSSKVPQQQAWAILGDFNTVRWDFEKQGGGARPNQSAMDSFNDCINTCGLEELQLKGSCFTQSNSSWGHDRIECKLDKALVNQA